MTEESGLDSGLRQWIFLFSTVSRLTMRPNRSLFQWMPRVPSPGIKRLGRESNHSSPPGAQVINKYMEPYLYSPIRLLGIVLDLAEGQF
jgi:hypothetical protein